jgi:AbiV family abortive infection protein
MIMPPKPWKLLYENIFARKGRTTTVELLSKGLGACTINAELLLKDVELLLTAKRYARAQFLLATVDKEMAKAHLVLDMCRLSFDNQENYLRQLCRAFYGHVEKYAYNKVSRSDVRDMPHAKEIFHFELIRCDHLETLVQFGGHHAYFLLLF